jgi:predicted site-specific integrase-resolvase
MKLLLSISQYCQRLGLHPQTLRKLEREGRSPHVPPARTVGNHRRYPVEEETPPGQTIGYARVSCADQKEDLPRQAQRIRDYAKDAVVITDTGSGLNCKKAGLTRLIKTLLSGTVRELVLTYKDRLLRFGSEIVFLICRQLNIKVTILQDSTAKSDDAQFCDDVISIITVFSAKLYGARSHRNRRAARAPTQLCST